MEEEKWKKMKYFDANVDIVGYFYSSYNFNVLNFFFNFLI
jgi:hypothetical protein